MRTFRLLLLVIVALQAGCSSLPEGQRRHVAWLEGTWEVPGIESCAALPRNVQFAPLRSKLYITYPHDSTNSDGESFQTKWVYRVLSATEERIRVSLMGEDRLDPSGLPVTWDIRKLSPDQYCWRRSDWPFEECTVARTRCGP